MLQTISADQITLYDLEQRFGLIQSDKLDFFEEWHTDLPILTTMEIDRLVRVRTAYVFEIGAEGCANLRSIA
jgi:hypothetical protein